MHEESTPLLERYACGELSAAEALALDQQLQRDRVLQQQLALQTTTIAQLRHDRHQQLKARLAALPLPPAPTVWPRYVLGGGSALLVAFGLTWWALRPAPYETAAPPVADRLPARPAPAAATSESAPARLEVPAPTPALPGTDKNGGRRSEAAAETEDLTAKKATPGGLPLKTAASEPMPAPVLTAPVAPDPTQLSGESSVPPSVFADDGRDLPGGIVAPQPGPPPAQTIRNSPRYNFHYRFTAGQFWLYGPFDVDLYKFMELKEPAGSRFYLYYQGHYYHLSVTDGVAPLAPTQVTSQALIKQLDSLR